MTFDAFFGLCQTGIAGGIAAALGVAVFELLEQAWRRHLPETPKGPPKVPPTTHTVQVFDDDGWPLRTYRVTVKDMARLVGDLDREHRR